MLAGFRGIGEIRIYMENIRDFRRENFAGQRLYRIPESVRRRQRARPFVRDFRMTDIGCFPEAAGHRVERPEGVPGDIFLFCEQGRGWLVLDGAPPASVAAGEAARIPARLPHAYGSAPGASWGLHWVHAEGDGLKDLLEWTSFCPRRAVVPCPGGPTVRRHLNAAMNRIDAGYTDAALLELTRRLIDALSALACDPVRRSGDLPEAERRIGVAMEWMREHLGESLDLADCARAAGYSVAHFCECFRDRHGTTPMQYLRELRMQRACHLLDDGSRPVKAIAPTVGYPDPLHFSRVFKGTTGLSPTAYRRRVR